jgi:hypothetical protein
MDSDLIGMLGLMIGAFDEPLVFGPWAVRPTQIAQSHKVPGKGKYPGALPSRTSLLSFETGERLLREVDIITAQQPV